MIDWSSDALSLEEEPSTPTEGLFLDVVGVVDRVAHHPLFVREARTPKTVGGKGMWHRQCWPSRGGWITAGFLAAYLIFMHSFWAVERATWKEEMLAAIAADLTAASQTLVEERRTHIQELLEMDRSVHRILLATDQRSQKALQAVVATIRSEYDTWLRARQQEWWSLHPEFRPITTSRLASPSTSSSPPPAAPPAPQSRRSDPP